MPPSLSRRFISSLYEIFLLIAIYAVAASASKTIFSLIGATMPTWLVQVIAFASVGVYFAYTWQKTGQSLAQKTWHLQVIRNQTPHQSPTAIQAWLRYCAAFCLGVLPALLFTQTFSASPNATLSFTLLIGAISMTLNWLALLGTSMLNQQRRALHEILSNTATLQQKNTEAP